ncbi:OmpA family protein [Chondrinema litorale]|uniref:OmpA family protein n=1 Tax=Chondrinema litorale TaxID=2994555 RepID=UPI00254350DE|nr:OmpA family protein [Chondrinema litorale]UZR96955.1 OmpA family protein [Chondrinema litorale]
MKIIALFFLVLLIANNNVFSQKKNSRKLKKQIAKADELAKSFGYVEALDIYKVLLDENRDHNLLKLKVAECYMKLNEPEKAVKWYGDIRESQHLFDKYNKLNYAQALISTERFEVARDVYSDLQKVEETKAHATERIKSVEERSLFFKDSAFYTIHSLALNTEGIEFSPSYYKEGILWVGERTKVNKKGIYSWDNSKFLDLYYLKYLDGENTYKEPFSKRVNSLFHEGPVVFFEDDTKMIFTRNNIKGGRIRRSKDNTLKLQLFSSELEGEDEWSKPKPLSFMHPEDSYGHPAISPDEKTLYFVSDMPGGLGGTDIYFSQLIDGVWTTPQNLGNKINTIEDEMFPFISKNNVLYFASNGHPAIGGLDNFYIQLNKEGKPEGEIVNMGYPINSLFDDFGVITKDNGRTGFFSSNRKMETSKDDIYSFEFDKPNTAKVIVKVFDVENEIFLPGAQIEITGEAKNYQAQSDDKGSYQFAAEIYTDYNIACSLYGYSQDTTNTTYRVKSIEPTEMIVKMVPRKLRVNGVVLDKKTEKPIADANVIIQNLLSSKGELVITDANGAFSVILPIDQKYDIKILADYYFTTHEKLETKLPPKGEEINEKYFLGKIEIGKSIKLDNIYYDLNSAEIKPEAALELDNLVTMLKENPKIKIELSSHTDSRAGDDYNLQLSQARAQSATDYIISQGIESNRIIARGYGEYQLLNHCKNGVDCDEKDHLKNRRTEFKILEINVE